MRWWTAVALAACADVKGVGSPNDQEVVTTVALAFAPAGGGDPIVARWADPENDGAPVVDEIVLADGADYDVSVSFLDELEDPPEDLTAEVADEGDQHQVFFTGSAVESPATGPAAGAVVVQAYADEDANGNPLGLENTFATRGPGAGDLVVVLRHLPEQDGAPQKTAGLAEDVADGGFSAIGGDDDANVTFHLSVE